MSFINILNTLLLFNISCLLLFLCLLILFYFELPISYLECIFWIYTYRLEEKVLSIFSACFVSYIKQKFPHIFIVLVPFYWKNRVRFLIIMRFSLEVRKEYIYRKFKHIVYHSWKIYLQDVWTFFNAWICIDLYQPQIEVFIYDEIISEYFKAWFSLLRINYIFSSKDRPDYKLFHFRD